MNTSAASPIADSSLIIAYSLLDNAGIELAAREPNTKFYAASTIKLCVMLAVACGVDAGQLSWDEYLVCHHSFPSEISGAPRFRLAADDVDPLFPLDGDLATVSSLTRMMICRSSNEATNTLVSRLGLTTISEVTRRTGAGKTRMERKIGDAAAIASGLTNETSPLDLAHIMRCIATGQLTCPKTTGLMRSILAEQQFPRISLELAHGIAWGSKSGYVPGIVHDVAYIGNPDSKLARYLAVCTRGFNEEQGHETIRAISRALLSTLDIL